MKTVLCLLATLVSASAFAANLDLRCNGDTAAYGEVTGIRVTDDHLVLFTTGATDFGTRLNATADQGSLFAMTAGARVTIPRQLLDGSAAGWDVTISSEGMPFEAVYCSR